MTDRQKERRKALAEAARALRIYREFAAQNNAERMRFWDGVFRFWLNEYREQSALVMSAGAD